MTPGWSARFSKMLATANPMIGESDNRYLTALDDDRRALGYVRRRMASHHGGCSGSVEWLKLGAYLRVNN
ncbi:glycine betaine/L-proline transport ATP binding subunit [Caballeronia telluris]|uniref:Glycine betaine/L-proline transport ATP binding subunit n=2 Tax=Caballeronia telluris TaxID=326475 RepID=A0A158F4L1_9BURK|nr:glycine betaine/L-proline transport ATP binding subunit [Caballeronia telluris]